MFHDSADPALDAALHGARPVPFWLDSDLRPPALPALAGDTCTELAVVGGGYTGLWTALLAKEQQPDREVLLLEGGRLGWAASGRNGGFCAASLTHGAENGRSHLAGEANRLEELGQANLDAIEATVGRYGWDCEFERTGLLTVATEPYQRDLLAAEPGALDAAQVRALVDSPTYLAGRLDTSETALVHPAKLVWELRRSCLDLGVRIVENTRVTGLTSDAEAVRVHTPGGVVTADRVALGTNVFPALLRRYRWHTVPVWDYVLVSEPLSTAQRASVGWAGREGLDDMGNQFHYYRLTADGRVLFGGYDAVYHFGRRVSRAHEHREESYRRLAAHFFQTFPQLAGLRFSHRWGGAIDTCTRFFPFFGTGHGGRVAHAAGFTGLGVGATRFAGQVMVDLLGDRATELTGLEMVRRRPLPFPPEPAAWAGIKLTTAALARADREEGRRNVLLRTLDRAGLGFDS